MFIEFFAELFFFRHTLRRMAKGNLVELVRRLLGFGGGLVRTVKRDIEGSLVVALRGLTLSWTAALLLFF